MKQSTAILPDGHSMFVFSLQAPDGERDVSSQFELLRRTADAIDDLGDVEIFDVVWRTDLTGVARPHSISVYYSQLVSPVACSMCSCHEKPAAGIERIINGYHRYYGNPEEARAFVKDVRNHDFVMSNPEVQPEICSVSKLLRRTAEAAEMLGKVSVDDIKLRFDLTEQGREPSITLYFSRLHRGGKKKPKSVPHQAPTTTEPDTSIVPEHHAVHRLLILDPRREPDYLSRPRLLRWTADALEDLGDVDVHDLVMHEELMDGKWVADWVSSVSVYYSLREQPPRASPEPATLCPAADFTASHKYFGDHIDPQMTADRANHMFYLYNPRGKRRFSLPTLLRRTARAIEDLVEVEIDGVVLHVQETAEERVPVVAVYYSSPTRGLQKSRRRLKRYAQYLERQDRKKRKRATNKRARKVQR
jgi:hypothetical protein